MKALDLAHAVAEIEAAELTDQTREIVLALLTRDRAARLALGEEHLQVCHWIRARLAEGRTPAYCFKMAIVVPPHPSEWTARRIWSRFEQLSPENLSTLRLISRVSSAS